MPAALRRKVAVVEVAELEKLLGRKTKSGKLRAIKQTELRALIREHAVEVPAIAVEAAGPRGEPLVVRADDRKPMFDGPFARALRAEVRAKVEDSASDFFEKSNGRR